MWFGTYRGVSHYDGSTFENFSVKVEIDNDWRPPTQATTFDYTFKAPGTHTVEVQAIDRDLVYSDPAGVTLTIILQPFYSQAIPCRTDL